MTRQPVHLFLSFLILSLSACARGPLRERREALRRVPPPALADDLPRAPLLAALDEQVAHLAAEPGAEPLVFGERAIPRPEYLAALRRFAQLGRELAADADFHAAVAREFDFYEVYGNDDGWGRAFMTSYYEPVTPGSLRRTDRFSQPVYRTPDDLLTLDLAQFDPRYRDDRKLRARLEGRSVVPYWSREEIDERGRLAGKGLELCWLDPLDAFLLHIQGSGTVALEGGRELRLNYAEKNGHPYEALGKFFRDQIPPGELNLHTIEARARALPPAELQRTMSRNPSYVFFRLSDRRALTSLGVPATDGRTIATDPRYFPKGALAYLAFDKPRFAGPDSNVPLPDGEPAARFVLDQDIGGAITGGGRLDLFWGRGADAKRNAGVIKNPARLYYLAPKPN